MALLVVGRTNVGLVQGNANVLEVADVVSGRAVQAGHEIARFNRAARTTSRDTTADSLATFPDDLGQVTPVLEGATGQVDIGVGVAPAGTTGIGLNFVVVPEIGDSVGDVGSAEIGSLSNIHACATRETWSWGLVEDTSLSLGLGVLGQVSIVRESVGGVVGTMNVVVSENRVDENIVTGLAFWVVDLESSIQARGRSSGLGSSSDGGDN